MLNSSEKEIIGNKLYTPENINNNIENIKYPNNTFDNKLKPLIKTDNNTIIESNDNSIPCHAFNIKTVDNNTAGKKLNPRRKSDDNIIIESKEEKHHENIQFHNDNE